MQKIPPDLNLPSNFTSQGARQFLTCWWKVEVLVAQLCPTLLGPYGFVAHQAPLSVGFSRQESGSGLPLLAGTCTWFEIFSIIFLISGFFSIFWVRISMYCLVSRNPLSNWIEGKPSFICSCKPLLFFQGASAFNWLQPWNWKTLAPWKIRYYQPRQHIKRQRHYFTNKVHLIKAMVFPVVMYGCESWTIRKAECWIIDAFELWIGEDSRESLGLQGDPTSPF